MDLVLPEAVAQAECVDHGAITIADPRVFGTVLTDLDAAEIEHRRWEAVGGRGRMVDRRAVRPLRNGEVEWT
jgi:hypothetical protein